MIRAEVIAKANELEETLRQAHGYSQEFYEELLDDYVVNVWALKSIGDSYPWERAIELQEKQQKIESRMPNITAGEFDEYTILSDQLAILFTEVPNVQRQNGQV